MTKSRSTTQKKPTNAPWYGQFILLCSDIIYRIGLSGFIVTSIVAFIYSFATQRQKEEIIDKWLLFKNNSPSEAFHIILIICALIIYIFEAYFFFKIRRLDRDEIKRLAEYKRLYQELMIGKRLKSSKETDLT